MDRWKSRGESSQRTERVQREEARREKDSVEEDPGARKGRQVARHCFCPMFCGSGGSKSRLAEAAGAEPSGQTRDAKSTSRSDHF